MALVARPLGDAFRHSMAGLKAQHAKGKRKAPSPLPSGTQIVDLTFEDDDEEQPVAKRHKSHPTDESNSSNDLSSPRVHPPLSNQQRHRKDVNSKTTAHFHLTASSAPAPLLPSTQPQVPGPGSSNWERKVHANGEGIYVNRKTKSSSRKFSSSPPSANSSSQKIASQRNVFVGTTESESEDVLQNFRLPKAPAIKFEAVASPIPTATGSKHTVHISGHQKHPPYDETDREKVKAISSSSSRPPSFSLTKHATPQQQNEAARQRQSQRESKVPERLVDQPQPPKLVNPPSRTTTPRVETQRRKLGQHREQSPIRSQISVVIPVSQHTSKPFVDPGVDQSRKQSLLREMKKGVDIVSSRAKSVERYFGTTGFSEIYGTTSDEERIRRIHNLQPRVKKVKRRNVKLDWGDDIPTPGPTRPFRHDKLVHPRELIKEITKSKVSSLPGPPITIVNDIDERGLSGKFQFINQYVIREGVKRQQAHLHSHVRCTCIGGCSPDTCACMRNKKMEIVNGAPVPTYRQRLDGLIVLTETFITLSKNDQARSEIVECNNNCHCDENCFNRVVQKGRTLPLEIHMTKFCGFGLRSPQDIVQGQFIDVYLGELITEATLDKRENAQVDGEPSYVFTLDYFNEEKQKGEAKAKANPVHYQIDGENFGSSMRFVNHSCNANCSVFSVMLKEYDQNIYGLAVFALRDIPAMAELTLDYAPEIDDDDIGDYAKCQCGEKNCRGSMWPKPRAVRKRKMRKAI